MYEGSAAERGKRITIIGISTLLLVAMVLAVFVGSKLGENSSNNEAENNNKNNHIASTMKAVQDLCHPTNYRKECEESLIAGAGNTTDPKELIKIAFNITITKIGDKLKKLIFCMMRRILEPRWHLTHASNSWIFQLES